ncbi:hypothetical protein Poli38472_006097 [Pythium oligandrum]|uniref:Metalloenzyme domain-containing protein n=1 Tax=Pythium oligandrum TaxID=41045 RepID=A0A8K1CSW4_PYTOL|nr:hypothetical protein Poli38472_006097 [Pythium oligandrum]|eukprot:TMW68629.1 hypothetical protein Poli38472_006097 [Pythium oligandrum]
MTTMETTTPRTRAVVFVLIDGLADVSLKQLGNKTTLEAANTPAMDAIARGGLSGLLDPVAPGYACGSDTAHMSIFGYDPFIHYRGRGSFEAMGAGLHMDKGDVAFKCNFATVKKNDSGELIVERRRVDRNFPEWGIDLCSFLNGVHVPECPEIHVATKYATEHRCGIVFKGKGLCDRISGSDPLKDNLPLLRSKPLDDSPEAAYSSKVLNEVSDTIHRELRTHPINVEREKQNLPPANVVLLRGPGERIDVSTFQEVHGMKPFMIAPTCIIAGLGMSLGIELLKVPGATGDYHTNLLNKAEAALQKFETDPTYEFCFLHIKAVDDAGHDKDVAKKIHFIEKADEMLGQLLRGIETRLPNHEVSVILTGDHTTPVLYGDHSFEPVPFAITRAGAALKVLEDKPLPPASALTDQVETFSELAVLHGALGRFSGDQVMKIVKNFREYEE